MGCYNAFGNVMIVCDSSELPSSASGFSSYNLEDFWDPSYILSKDQQGETGGFAELNFTSYMLYMKDKEGNFFSALPQTLTNLHKKTQLLRRVQLMVQKSTFIESP